MEGHSTVVHTLYTSHTPRAAQLAAQVSVNSHGFISAPRPTMTESTPCIAPARISEWLPRSTIHSAKEQCCSTSSQFIASPQPPFFRAQGNLGKACEPHLHTFYAQRQKWPEECAVRCQQRTLQLGHAHHALSTCVQSLLRRTCWHAVPNLKQAWRKMWDPCSSPCWRFHTGDSHQVQQNQTHFFFFFKKPLQSNDHASAIEWLRRNSRYPFSCWAACARKAARYCT